MGRRFGLEGGPDVSVGARPGRPRGARPDEIEALVLVDPPLNALTHDRTDLAPLLAVFETIRALLVDTGGGDTARSALLERFPDAELGADQASRTDPERVASYIDMSTMQDRRYVDMFEAIAQPTLLLQADPASAAALSDHDAQAALGVLANGRLVGMPGVGHMIQDEAPEAYAREVLAFLEEAG